MQSEARVGNSQVATELSHKLGAITLPNQEVHLERACALAQLARMSGGQEKVKLMDEALVALERSVSEGYQDPFRISTDPDLKPFREEARVNAIVQKLKSAAGD